MTLFLKISPADGRRRHKDGFLNRVKGIYFKERFGMFCYGTYSMNNSTVHITEYFSFLKVRFYFKIKNIYLVTRSLLRFPSDFCGRLYTRFEWRNILQFANFPYNNEGRRGR
jgi:hypothetical protein